MKKYGVCAIIYREGMGDIELLVCEFSSGKIGLISGRKEKNENFEDCLKREVFEETGIKIFDFIETEYKNIFKRCGNLEEQKVYLIKISTDAQIRKSEEHRKLFWIKPTEVEKTLSYPDLTSIVKKCLKRYLGDN